MEQALPTHAHTVIIGGGVMGASCAYHLASMGAQDVVLLEREPDFGLGATGRCAGGVRYQFGTEINVRLSLASLAMLEEFRQTTGVDPAYRKCGYLFVLTRPQDVETFRRNVALQHRLGVRTQWLTGEQVRAHLPMMRFEDALAGTFGPDDGLADPHSVVSGYLGAARRLGVRAFTAATVTGLRVAGERVQAVAVAGREITAKEVVIAAGPWAAQVGAMAGLQIPITPLRRQWLTTTPLPDLPPDFPFVIDFAQALYFHREGQGVLTGMSNPNEKPGFDQRLDPQWELVHMEAAIKRFPALERAGRLAAQAGLYEVTPDAHPIFGPTPIEGLWIVAGFSGHGFMHGPVAGKVMAEWMLEGSPKTVDVSALDLARFREGRLIQEYNVV